MPNHLLKLIKTSETVKPVITSGTTKGTGSKAEMIDFPRNIPILSKANPIKQPIIAEPVAEKPAILMLTHRLEIIS